MIGHEARTNELLATYTAELDAWTAERVPKLITNIDYAARSAALMIALNRELARCAVAFGEAHELDTQEVASLVIQQFVKNFQLANEAVSKPQMGLIQ